MFVLFHEHRTGINDLTVLILDLFCLNVIDVDICKDPGYYLGFSSSVYAEERVSLANICVIAAGVLVDVANCIE